MEAGDPAPSERPPGELQPASMPAQGGLGGPAPPAVSTGGSDSGIAPDRDTGNGPPVVAPGRRLLGEGSFERPARSSLKPASDLDRRRPSSSLRRLSVVEPGQIHATPQGPGLGTAADVRVSGSDRAFSLPAGSPEPSPAGAGVGTGAGGSEPGQPRHTGSERFRLPGGGPGPGAAGLSITSTAAVENFKDFHSALRSKSDPDALPWYSVSQLVPEQLHGKLLGHGRHLGYAWPHVAALLIIALVTSGIIAGIERDGAPGRPGPVPFIDCLFMAMTSLSNTGLITVAPQMMNTGSCVIFILLMSLCSPSVTSLAIAGLRRRHLARMLTRRDLAPGAIKELRAEHTAYGKLIIVVPAILLCFVSTGTIILGSYLTYHRPDIPGRMHPWWFALFDCCSSFFNTGLSLFYRADTGQVATDTLMLLVFSVLGLAGSTCFPIVLRLVLGLLERLSAPGSEHREAYHHLLNRSHIYYSHLFSRTLTWLLAYILAAIQVIASITFLALEYNAPILAEYTGWERFLSALFLNISARSMGTSNLPFGLLTGASQIVFLVIMWIAAFPVLDESEDTENDAESPSVLLNLQANSKKVVTDYTIWALFLLFLILAIESQRMYYDTGINVFGVIFEVISAYGTVGYSLGHPAYVYESLSVAFSPAGKICVMCLMMLGRHKDLNLFMGMQARLFVEEGAVLKSADAPGGGSPGAGAGAGGFDSEFGGSFSSGSFSSPGGASFRDPQTLGRDERVEAMKRRAFLFRAMSLKRISSSVTGPPRGGPIGLNPDLMRLGRYEPQLAPALAPGARRLPSAGSGGLSQRAFSARSLGGRPSLALEGEAGPADSVEEQPQYEYHPPQRKVSWSAAPVGNRGPPGDLSGASAGGGASDDCDSIGGSVRSVGRFASAEDSLTGVGSFRRPARSSGTGASGGGASAEGEAALAGELGSSSLQEHTLARKFSQSGDRALLEAVGNLAGSSSPLAPAQQEHGAGASGRGVSGGRGSDSEGSDASSARTVSGPSAAGSNSPGVSSARGAQTRNSISSPRGSVNLSAVAAVASIEPRPEAESAAARARATAAASGGSGAVANVEAATWARQELSATAAVVAAGVDPAQVDVVLEGDQL